jgi:capsular exopolysaccharide synthesis family protein
MEEIIIQDTKSELSKLSLKDMFYKYVRFLPLFIISVALSLFVAYIYLRYSTPVYQSASTLSIEDDKKQSSGGDKFEQVLNSSNNKNIQNEIEVLKSRPLMERVVKELNLNFSYYAIGKIKELNIYNTGPFYIEAFEITDSSNAFNLNFKFIDHNTFHVNNENTPFTFGQVFKNPFGVFRLTKKSEVAVNSEYRINWSPTYNVASALSNELVVVPKTQGTSILTLSLESTNPQLAADVLNRLMDEYSQYTLEKKNQTNQQSKAFIDARLKVVAHELDSINAAKNSFMRANNIVNPETQTAQYFSQLTDADKILNEQSIQYEIANSIDGYLRNKQNAFDPVPSSLGLGDATLNNMIAAYNVAQMERKTLVDGNTPRENVLVKQKEEQVEKLRKNILENLRNVKGALGTTVQSYRTQRSQAQGQISTIPGKAQTLKDYERQQGSKLAVYNFLMEEREKSALAIAANIPNSKVVDQALVNAVPVKPNKRMVQIIAILVGLVLPALFIFVIEILNDKITTRFDIERITNATILGEVGHSYADAPLVATQNNRSIVAEQFRIIRSNLQYVLNHVKQPVILVTSSFSGEGKSFVSTNVGAVLSLAGKKTIILEFDIRKPKVLSHLGLPKRPGLTNYLLGKAELNDLPVAVPGLENLYVLPCGPVPPNPSEMLLDERMNDLFAYLRNHFEVIVIDTAPIGMVSDAMTLSKYADASLYIVRQGHTFKRQIGLIDEYYKSNKLPRISIVLNDVKVRAGYGYYGYGRYGYGYGYGSGYFDDETPPPSLVQEWLGWIGFSKNGKKKKRKKTRV